MVSTQEPPAVQPETFAAVGGPETQGVVSQENHERRSMRYSSSDGRLPTAYGFELIENDPKQPRPIIDQRTLCQGPTSRDGTQYWTYDDIPIDFSADGPGVSAEWIVRVNQSTYHSRPHYRTGWHVAFRDKKSRFFIVFIGPSEVALVNDDPDRRPVVEKFNAADRFHHYRLVIDNNVAQLFVDGAKEPIVTRPVGRAAPELQHAFHVYFGDGTRLAGGTFQLNEFFYVNDADVKSDFHP